MLLSGDGVLTSHTARNRGSKHVTFADAIVKSEVVMRTAGETSLTELPSLCHWPHVFSTSHHIVEEEKTFIVVDAHEDDGGDEDDEGEGVEDGADEGKSLPVDSIHSLSPDDDTSLLTDTSGDSSRPLDVSPDTPAAAVDCQDDPLQLLPSAFSCRDFAPAFSPLNRRHLNIFRPAILSPSVVADADSCDCAFTDETKRSGLVGVLEEDATESGSIIDHGTDNVYSLEASLLFSPVLSESLNSENSPLPTAPPPPPDCVDFSFTTGEKTKQTPFSFSDGALDGTRTRDEEENEKKKENATTVRTTKTWKEEAMKKSGTATALSDRHALRLRAASQLSQYSLAVLSTRPNGLTTREILSKRDWKDDDDNEDDDDEEEQPLQEEEEFRC